MFKINHIVVVLLCCVAIQLGHANTIITNPGPGLPTTPIGNTTAGFDFTVGSMSLMVTALGMWDQSQNGFTNAHTVGLWDISGNLLAQASLSPGTANPLIGDFRYVTLATPITLTAGMSYVLGATYVNADLDRVIVNVSGNQATFDPAITPGDFRQNVGLTGLLFPSSNIQTGSVVGPNAVFSPVPEGGPGLVCVALTLVALILVRRRMAPTP
jgi:hypothetical protein